MWLLRWKKPSELSVNTEKALPPVPTSHGGIERKVVAEGLQGGEAHVVLSTVVLSTAVLPDQPRSSKLRRRASSREVWTGSHNKEPASEVAAKARRINHTSLPR